MQRVASIDDPRLAPYRNLRDRTLRGESLFIAEGILLVQRLLASRFQVASILADESSAEQLAPWLAARAPLYVGSAALLKQIVGFDFHRGALAVGRRLPLPSVGELLEAIDSGGPLGLLVCPKITQPENMGLVLRTAAAFGVDGVVFGRRCCDPFSRRCLRVSMGGSLVAPLAWAADLPGALPTIERQRRIELVATVLDPAAQPLSTVDFAERTAILLGNEYEGLEPEVLAVCRKKVTVPMGSGTDSLNLGVATGVFLYEWYRQRCAAAEGGYHPAGLPPGGRPDLRPSCPPPDRNPGKDR
jgi:tRNA G18 (ribose-2'-O)-methylase SpoU